MTVLCGVSCGYQREGLVSTPPPSPSTKGRTRGCVFPPPANHILRRFQRPSWAELPLGVLRHNVISLQPPITLLWYWPSATRSREENGTLWSGEPLCTLAWGRWWEGESNTISSPSPRHGSSRGGRTVYWGCSLPSNYNKYEVPSAFTLLNIYSTNYPVIVHYLFISAVFVLFNMLIEKNNNVFIFNLIFLFAYLNVHSSFCLLVRVSMVP